MEQQTKRRKLQHQPEMETSTSAVSPHLDNSTPSSQPSTPLVILPIQELCPNGDLTLLVGKDPVHIFLVSRTVLSLASPVFRAMLTGKFVEASKEVVELEDDDPDALLVVLRVAHFRYNEVHRKLSDSCLLQVAIICDKYDMVAICRPFIPGWAEPYLRQYSDQAAEGKLWVAWVFGYEQEFTSLADRLRLVITTNADGACRHGQLTLGCSEMLLDIVGIQAPADWRK